MKIKLASLFVLGFVLTAAIANGQDRVNPNKVYKSGDELNVPLLGISMMIPEGWTGYLPREAGIFVLNKINDQGTEVFIFARENTLGKIKNNFKRGLNLSPSIQLIVEGTIEEKDGIISAPVSYTGTTGGQRKAHTFAKCGDYGICASMLLASTNDTFDQNKSAIQQLIADMEFGQLLTEEELISEVNWNDYLEEKYLYSKTATGGQNSVIQLWLNRDHTFSSKVIPEAWTSTPNKKYKGKQKGDWTVMQRDGVDFLVLNYYKLDQLLVSLKMSGDEHRLNDHGFFIIKQ